MGILPDEDILSLICYDLEDDAFTDMLKPSVEEGHGYQTQDVSLGFLRATTTSGLLLPLPLRNRLITSVDEVTLEEAFVQSVSITHTIFLPRRLSRTSPSRDPDSSRKHTFSDTWFIDWCWRS